MIGFKDITIVRNLLLEEKSMLVKLIQTSPDALSFAKNAVLAIRSGELVLKDRGASNMRELVDLYYRVKYGSKKDVEV